MNDREGRNPSDDAEGNETNSEDRETGKPKGMSSVGVALWSVVGAVAIVTVAAFVAKRPKAALPELTEKPMAVRTLVMAPTSMRDTVVLPGWVEPFAKATVAAQKPGRVVEILVEKGHAVTNGQALMRVDDRIWRAHLAQARVEHREAESTLRRWEQMKATGAVSDQEYAAVQQRLDMATAALQAAETQVDQCTVISPLTGFVDDRLLEVGEHAAEGAAGFLIADIRTVKIAFDVPEQDIAAVHPGMMMEAKVAVYPGVTLTGTVSFVAGAGHEKSHSYRAELALDNPDMRLRPGMIADVSLVRRVREDAMMLPLAAVVPQRQDHVVFVVEDGRAVRRVVRIEFITGQNAVLSTGVKPGEKIVIEGQRLLDDGALIREMEAPQTPADARVEAAGETEGP